MSGCLAISSRGTATIAAVAHSPPRRGTGAWERAQAPGQQENGRDLAEVGRLAPETADADPTARAAGLVAEERDRGHRRHGHEVDPEGVPKQQRVVDECRGDQDQHTRDDPHRLTRHVVGRQFSRSARDQGQADHGQSER